MAAIGEMVSVGQAARELGVSAEYLRRLIRRGDLRGVSTVLGTIIDPAEVDRLARERAARQGSPTPA